MAILCKWEELPDFMRTDEVRPYYVRLRKKKAELLLKRFFDIAFSLVLLAVLFPVMLATAVIVSLDSEGGSIFKQKRITRYGREFYIFKYRTMTAGSENGSGITIGNDPRITRAGRFLRRSRLDELPQLINILRGEMSFVGTRPEIPEYVEKYTPEMFATLLLPAGVTSGASIKFRNEDRMLGNAENADEIYSERILPEKMKYNLDDLKNFSLLRELGIILGTVPAVLSGNKKTE